MEEQIQKFLFSPVVGKLATIFIGITIIWLIIKMLKKNWFSKIEDNDNRYKAKKIGSFIGYLLTIILITVVYSEKLHGLTVAIGVAGAGIAFALQEVIASFAGWLMIVFGGFYKPGDRIQLGGTKGDVMDIGVLRTTIMETGQWISGDAYNGRIVLIANSFVFKEPVFNYSGEFPFLWDEIKIPIQFGSNYEKATELFEQIGKEVEGEIDVKSKEQWAVLQHKYRLEDTQTQPVVSLIVNDNWVEFTLRYVVDYKMRRATKTLLFTKILKRIEAPDSEIKFASTTFQLTKTPEIKVSITK